MGITKGLLRLQQLPSVNDSESSLVPPCKSRQEMKMSTRFSNYTEKSYTQIVKEWILEHKREKEFCVFDLSAELGLPVEKVSTSLNFLKSAGMIKTIKIISSAPYNNRQAQTRLYKFEKEIKMRHNSRHKEGTVKHFKKGTKKPKLIVGPDVLVEFPGKAYMNVLKPKRERAKYFINGILEMLIQLDLLLAE